ncbi:MAG: BrnA antitoxin family protein [Rickettsiales bacterium]|nr:BrnA antitoxin family protein [Rickettsiales bacterium]
MLVRRGKGRPPSLTPKVSQTLRLDADILEAFKSTGAGWQTRMNDALRKAAARLG